MTLRVAEIFYSLEGEGKRAGAAAAFIRLAGCNLRCSYCDTAHALAHGSGAEMTLEEILARVDCARVTLTGGEPLLAQGAAELVRVLIARGCEVNIETNGSIDVKAFRESAEVGDSLQPITPDAARGSLFFTIDYKLPSSGVCDAMLDGNFFSLRAEDVLKFVVGAREDVPAMLKLVERMRGSKTAVMPHIFIGAAVRTNGGYGIALPALAGIIKREPLLRDARLQLQLHKIIWGADAQGV